jgi:glutamate-ammonia-ligase adenylyltransferase
MLVTSYEGFERYQRRDAETWEHIALLRARAIAGSIEPAQLLIDRIRRAVVGTGRAPWRYLADLRSRVEHERAPKSDGRVPIKTGRGGVMDVDFLATGGILECGAAYLPELPSVPAMLNKLELGSAADSLLADYLALRVIEARCRWLRGRAVEELETADEPLALTAELVEPGLSGPALLARVADVRARVRSAFDAVVEGGSIRRVCAD